jgi:hypothetical protein
MTQTAPHADRLIRLRTPRDVVATIPRFLGYRPRRSIVFLNQHAGGRMSTMRVDLPAPASQAVEKKLATSLTGLLCKVPDVVKTLVVVYADGAFAAGGDVPRGSFIRPLVRRLVSSGFDVHDALCVADDAWGAYDGADAGIPHPLDELLEPAPGDPCADLPAGDAAEAAALPIAGGLARQAFDAAVDRACAGLAALRPVEAAEDALELDLGTADSDALAAVLAPMTHPESRDAMLFTWAWGADAGYELLEEAVRIDAGEVGPEDDSIALDLMGLGHAAAPERRRIDTAIAVMGRIAALAPVDLAHVAYTVLAWLHWSQGRGSVAGVFLDRALDADPGYPLAELMSLVLGQGRLPEWVYRLPGADERGPRFAPRR